MAESWIDEALWEQATVRKPGVPHLTVVLDPNLGAVAALLDDDGNVLGTGASGPWAGEATDRG